MPELPTIAVDPSNADQARSWDGAAGDYWAEHAERFDRSMAGYLRPFLHAAGIEARYRVLDIGCGTGQTTLAAARCAADGSALGIDLSARMIDVARRQAAREAVPNARFEHADAQILPFPPDPFDIAISRTGAMFFGRPQAAFARIARALRPGGRLTLLSWQPAARNEWFSAFSHALTGGRELPAAAVGAPGPFSMSDPGRVRTLLSGAGFADVQLTAERAVMQFGRDVDDAQDFLLGQLGWMLPADDGTARARAVAALRCSLRGHLHPGGVSYDSAAWIITAHRHEDPPCESPKPSTTS